MGKDFLSSTDMARTLHRDFAENTSIPDYHCHTNPQEIYEDRKFDTITQVWLGGDHYKWRQMRSNGVDERYVTGDSTDRERFQVWVETMSKLISDPLYHWSHLELRKYLGYQGYLNGDIIEEVWNLCNTKPQEDPMTVRSLIGQPGVILICTTDDPVDSLKWHKKIVEDDTFDIQVLPAWRSDKAMNVEKPSFGAYMTQLFQVGSVQTTDFTSLKEALRKHMMFFASMGCCVSNHALEYMMYVPVVDSKVDVILARGLRGEAVIRGEELKFKAALILFVTRKHNAMEWIMQIHYSCRKDNSGYMFGRLGVNTGFDCINGYAPSAQMTGFLNVLSTNNETPETILYSPNPNNNTLIRTIIGYFQGKSPSKVQQESARWFNDHRTGMTEQMISSANLRCLDNFIGMLTGSRGFLSYARHGYFRHILCSPVGGWVKNDGYLADIKTLEEIVKGIYYNNTTKYFGFKLDEAE